MTKVTGFLGLRSFKLQKKMISGKKKILIVEDEKPIASALELKLNGSGFEARVALNGEDALEIMRTDKIDLILLDLVMPRMNGFEFLENLRDMKVDIPVIVASNLSQEEDIKRVKELGVDTYFIKSNVSIAQIVQYIEEALSRSRRIV